MIGKACPKPCRPTASCPLARTLTIFGLAPRTPTSTTIERCHSLAPPAGRGLTPSCCPSWATFTENLLLFTLTELAPIKVTGTLRELGTAFSLEMLTHGTKVGHSLAFINPVTELNLLLLCALFVVTDHSKCTSRATTNMWSIPPLKSYSGWKGIAPKTQD